MLTVDTNEQEQTYNDMEWIFFQQRLQEKTEMMEERMEVEKK